MKQKHSYLPLRSLRQNRTRKQRMRKRIWEKRFERWREELREYRQHIIKTIITLVITALVAHFLGFELRKATQQVLDSLTELLNRLG